jgi:hypothetical protein
MQQSILVLVAMLLFSDQVKAQRFDKLVELKDQEAKVYYSKGHEQRALSIAARLDKAMAYNQGLTGFKPAVTMLILSAADWESYTKFPVYGMPHYNDDKTLIVAVEDNAFWKSFVPLPEQMPEELREPAKITYGLPDGSLSMRAFFDLLAIHELGHAFHIQGGLTMQRKWMGELFVNILLHTYIAENEPEQLPALTLFPKIVVTRGSKGFQYTSLKDIEERYEEIGKQHPHNYGWYQCRWHAAAATIYNSGGKQLLIKLWTALKEQKEILNETALASFLETRVDKTVADVMRDWDK